MGVGERDESEGQRMRKNEREGVGVGEIKRDTEREMRVY